MGVRDPLSVAYDSRVRRVLLRAIIARRSDRGVPTFVESRPASEFRHLDKGGRTRHERAFTRSAYYQVFKVPRNLGELPFYSLRLDWGKIEFRRGRWGRVVQVRLFRYGSGRRHAERAGGQWITDDARRSVPGNRIDDAG